jgi:hypothetical protein
MDMGKSRRRSGSEIKNSKINRAVAFVHAQSFDLVMTTCRFGNSKTTTHDRSERCDLRASEFKDVGCVKYNIYIVYRLWQR